MEFLPVFVGRLPEVKGSHFPCLNGHWWNFWNVLPKALFPVIGSESSLMLALKVSPEIFQTGIITWILQVISDDIATFHLGELGHTEWIQKWRLGMLGNFAFKKDNLSCWVYLCFCRRFPVFFWAWEFLSKNLYRQGATFFPLKVWNEPISTAGPCASVLHCIICQTGLHIFSQLCKSSHLGVGSVFYIK